MDSLFINAYQDSDNSLSANLETLIILSIYELIGTEKVQLVVKIHDEKPQEPLILIDFTEIKYQTLTVAPELTENCVWPVIIIEHGIIAGLCSVARQLIKRSDAKEVRSLLGFRKASLLACSESSIWTRFCEVDIIRTTKKLIQNDYNKANKFYLPEDIARFEFHMSKPVRMHNIYKAAREKNNDKDLQSNVPLDKLNLDHTYGEGTFMTLADVILYPCYKILLSKCPKSLLEQKLPLTLGWYSKIASKSLLPVLKFTLPQTEIDIIEVVEPSFVKQSLYTADPSRYKPERRIYTKQNDIEDAVKTVSALDNEIVNGFLPYGYEIQFDWADLPLEANPNSGALPKKRASRKCEQLENLARAVIKLAGDKKYKIVDFCSGSGHLGILLAVLLPNCEIILVENKEQSLARARERIKNLKLNNVLIIQSNLDYFHGTYDIGVALHACGVATDLVIQSCINNEAHFVTCPCCYGGVKDCYHLKYPRSKQFQKLSLGYKNYLSLAHAADQTHDADNVKTKQGFFCMDVIDTDRKLYAESCGYDVYLGKLQPASCTNKNNLLVGICRGKQ